ncbi:MAG: hypothetical protein MJA31_01565 [Clostridia bacterium]|nr:hypothetical protein [Clostridia bacterium]
MYRLFNLKRDGTQYDVTNLVSKISWEGDIYQTARQLNVDMIFSDDYYTPKYEVDLGSRLILKNDDIEIMDAFVFTVPKSHNNTISIDAYDGLIYLLKSKATKIVKNISVTQFIKSICEEFEITMGSIPEIPLIITQIFRDMTPYDMIIKALSEAAKRTESKYQVSMKEGKLVIIDRSINTPKWKIKTGSNLIHAALTQSIEEMQNKIVITGSNDQILAIKQKDELISQYGLLQGQYKEQCKSLTDAELIGERYLEEHGKVSKTLTIESIGIDDIRAGDAVIIEDERLGLNGIFNVTRDIHNVENGVHKMNLDLSYIDQEADTSEVINLEYRNRDY